MSISDNKGKHLTWDDRDEIRKGLKSGMPFCWIAEQLGRDSTTISKEVQKHRYKKEIKRISWVNDCFRQEACRNRNLCGKPSGHKCSIACKNCMSCRKHCPDYRPESCPIEHKPPYVCNGCKKQALCRLDKFYYGPDSAQGEYRRKLVEARQGINMTKDELQALDNLVTPLIRKGQPLSHIFSTHQDDIPVCQRTLYRYVEARFLSVMNLDMRRTVRYKPRRKHPLLVVSKRKDGYRYADFQKLIDSYPLIRVVEMDTVEGTKGGKLLLTLLFRKINLMLAFLIPNKEMETVIAVIDSLEKRLGSAVFQELFPVLLTDNGCEFADPARFETSIEGGQRTHIYYCDPRMSNQKGALEKNHEYIRYVLPKGTSFDDLTGRAVQRIVNHINNTARPGLGSRTPMSLALQVLDVKVLESLGLITIPADEVCLTKALLQQ